MEFKQNRSMKVYDCYINNKYVPQIRLQGKWLEELGFECGKKINVECRGGQLILTLQDESIFYTDLVAEESEVDTYVYAKRD